MIGRETYAVIVTEVVLDGKVGERDLELPRTSLLTHFVPQPPTRV